MNKKQINIKTMNILTTEETKILLENLKNMDQFEFLVDLQISIQ